MSPRLARALTGAAALAVLTTTVTVTAITPTGSPDAARSSQGEPGTRANSARRAAATMPLAFEANRGQTDRRVRYLARGAGFTLFLTERGAVFDLQREGSGRGVAVALDPVGADPTPRLTGRVRQAATSSYFLGDDPRRWRRGVPGFAEVRYEEVYPGIDLEFRGDRSGAEYDFVVAPGVDPGRIGYRLRGTDGLRLDDDGDLVAPTAVGDFVHRAPVAYQRIDGARVPVSARYRLADGVVGFQVGTYDPGRPLVIDPDTDLEYSTFLGGGGGAGAGDGSELGEDLAVDGDDVYLTGATQSADFPTTTGAYDDTTNGVLDAFAAKFTSDGAGGMTLAYSTFIGGSDLDYADSIAVSQGDVYLTGDTESKDFPVTAGAYDPTANGDQPDDAFVVRLSPDGQGAADLAYSTFLGSSGYERASGIAVDGGDISVAGYTASAAFPTTPGAYDTSFGRFANAYYAVLSPDGAGAADLVYSTFLGGNGQNSASDVTLAGGDAFVTGETTGTDFPTTVGAYDRSYSRGGRHDIFMVQLSPDGAGGADLVYSTYLGVGGDDSGWGVAVSEGDVYLTGLTSSPRFPTVTGAYDRTFNGEYDAFVVRLSPDGNGAADLRYSTFLGGRGEDFATDLTVVDEDAYVVGGTDSAGFPTTRGAYDRSANGELDAFISRIRTGPGTAGLAYSTFLGGSRWDITDGIAVVGGTVLAGGDTQSAGFPTTPGAFDQTRDGPSDAFVARVRTPDRRFRPDGWIRLGRGRDHGDDVYNTTGRRQTSAAHARRGEGRVFWVTAQNDSRLPDRFGVTGPGSTPRWRIRYHAGGEDITGHVVDGGYTTRRLGRGDRQRVRVTVLPRATAPLGSRTTPRIALTSQAEPDRQDVVRARVTVDRD